MKKSYLSFILPSLLSGCTGISGSNNITDADTPALVFVDGQISDSAAVLAHTQQRLSTPAVATTPQTVSSPGTIKTMESFSESRPLAVIMALPLKLLLLAINNTVYRIREYSPVS